MENVKEGAEDTELVVAAVPLLAPAAGVPQLIADEPAFEKALRELELGTGPFAIDAERASGF
jgi:ribonuclease D